MLIVRWIVLLLLAGSVLCFAAYIGTRERHWLQRGILIVKWTVIAALAFFAALILERMAIAL
jgi:hypothetical protein